MAGRFLLDTNAIIALFAKDASINALVADLDVVVPMIALGELYAGALNSAKVEANVRRIDDFILKNHVVECDAATSWHYGQLKHALRIKGRPTPENDIWIGAIARQHRLSVVTRDEHFDEFPDLAVVRW